MENKTLHTNNEKEKKKNVASVLEHDDTKKGIYRLIPLK